MSRILKAKVLAVDSVHVHICCPICGKLHMHGSNGKINEQNYGYRVPHCGTTTLPWIDGIFWENPWHYSYELICTPETVRQKEDATPYVKRWYRKNKLAAYKMYRRWIADRVRMIVEAEGISLWDAYERIMADREPEIQIP